MIVKNINEHKLILDNLFKVNSNINKNMYKIELESNDILNKLTLNELKKDLLESFNLLGNNITNNLNIYYTQKANRLILECFRNINEYNSKEKLSLLAESIFNLTDTLEYNYTGDGEIDLINARYIRSMGNLIRFDTKLYEIEYNCHAGYYPESYNDIIKSNLQTLMEETATEVTKGLTDLKVRFGNKHNEIYKRDSVWMKEYKKDLLNLDFDQIEMEVVNDTKYSLDDLINRFNSFIKATKSGGINKYKDKNDNLKNGLDNYFRTGSVQREPGLKKVSGDGAKLVVEEMIAYCESFLNGKATFEGVIDEVISSSTSTELKENYSHIYRNDFNPFEFYSLKEAAEDEEQPKEEKSKGEKEAPAEEEPAEEKETNKVEDVKEEVEDQNELNVGIAVFLTVAESRYFDYMNVLKGLNE